MKNVLVLLHDDSGQDSRLTAALDLAKALGGHLTCLDVTVMPPVAAFDYLGGTGDAMVIEHLHERERANRKTIAARLEHEGVTWSMLEGIGDPACYLENAADLADIIVVSGAGIGGQSDERHLVGELVVKSDRPILAVPRACRTLDFAGKVLVAWNGSDQANEALHAAVPLLQHAQSVTLLQVNASISDFTLEAAVSYLALHDIAAETLCRSTDNPVSDVIVAEARALEASYIVIGAFGLPRTIEAIFGGVTLGVLHKSDVPVLLVR